MKKWNLTYKEQMMFFAGVTIGTFLMLSALKIYGVI